MATLSSPTLQSLLSDTRVLLNQQDPNNSFWKDTELTSHLNEGVRIYFMEVERANEGQFTAQTDLNIVNNAAEVALPADFYKVRTLYKKVSDGYIALPYRNTINEGYSTQGGSGSDTYLPSYHFRGNNLVLRPTPNYSETAGLRLEYVQFPDTMVWGGDSLTSQVSPIFKNLIVAYAVYKAKLKESMVNGVDVHSIAEKHLAVLYDSFKNAIAPRSKNQTFVVPFHPED